MLRLKPFAWSILALVMFSPRVHPKEAAPPETRNAALRYWMAFAVMSDTTARPEVGAMLVRVASGNATWDAWDEAHVGPILDQNREALEIMRRATRLPECNWGLEYELGPETPVPYLAKGLALARLNVMDGMRKMSRNDSAGAAEAWLAGLRFAQDLARGSSFIGALTAQAALVSDLNAINQALRDHKLEPKLMAPIRNAVAGLPPYGLDWSAAVRWEGLAGEITLRQLQDSKNPGNLYRTMFGEEPPPGFGPPDSADLGEWKSLIRRATGAFSLPEPRARDQANSIEQQTKLRPAVRRMWPSLTRLLEARDKVESARQAVLKALG